MCSASTGIAPARHPALAKSPRLLLLLAFLQEFDRPNSAYMLFYERAGSSSPGAATAPAAAPDATSAVAEQPSPVQAAPRLLQPPAQQAEAGSGLADMAVSPAMRRPHAAGALPAAVGAPTAAAEGPVPMAASGNAAGAQA